MKIFQPSRFLCMWLLVGSGGNRLTLSKCGSAQGEGGGHYHFVLTVVVVS